MMNFWGRDSRESGNQPLTMMSLLHRDTQITPQQPQHLPHTYHHQPRRHPAVTVHITHTLVVAALAIIVAAPVVALRLLTARVYVLPFSACAYSGTSTVSGVIGR
jgi:hypothetical protein